MLFCMFLVTKITQYGLHDELELVACLVGLISHKDVLLEY